MIHRSRSVFFLFGLIVGFLLVLFIVNGQPLWFSRQTAETYGKMLGAETKAEVWGLPFRLIIQRIFVDAAIQSVGVMDNGVMGVPSNIVDVGWFSAGPRPGENGSAVVVGHLDGENGEAGVFANLSKLKTGDRVYIEDDKGKLSTFIVRELREYDPGQADDVFSLNDSPHLNLVTCNGVWDATKYNYTKRLVVFTDIEL